MAGGYVSPLVDVTSYLLLILYPFYNISTGLSNIPVLLDNRYLSEYVIPYGSFDESFNYPKQSLRNCKKQKNNLVANRLMLKQTISLQIF